MICPDPPPCLECGTKENLTFDSENNTICVECYEKSMTNKEIISNILEDWRYNSTGISTYNFIKQKLQKALENKDQLFITELKRVECNLDLHSNGRELIKNLIKKYEKQP